MTIKTTVCTTVLFLMLMMNCVCADTTNYVYVADETHSLLSDFIEWFNDYYHQNVYDFPACDIWNITAIDDITGQVQPVCLEHRHLNGSVVICGFVMFCIIFVVWWIQK